MRVKVFETVTAGGLEKDVNKFLEENEGFIEVIDLIYRLTTSTHGIVITYKHLSREGNWN